MARPTPRAIVLVTFLCLAATTLFVAFASAQDGTGGDAGGNQTNDTNGTGEQPAGGDGAVPAYDYAITWHEGASDPAFAWDITALDVPAGARILAIYDSTGASGLHNVAFTVGDETIVTGPPINPDEGRQASPVFQMPESGTVPYVCQVHPEMTGTLTVAEAFGGGGGGGGPEHITHEGVNFLAHWVGVIAFAVLFIIYGLAFFLFKYNETGFTTDHKDRATPAGGGRAESYGEPFLTKRSTVVVVGLLLAALVTLLALALARGVFG